jgi:tetratricopeptide (TPR) repeat protein
MPTDPDVKRYMTAAAGLEATGHLDAASRAYRAATLQWSDEPLPWLGLANVAALREDWTAAEQGYRKVLALEPRQAAALNNRAEALRHLGCVDAARALLLDATTSLPPDDPLRPALAATLAQIEADGGSTPTAACMLQ